MRIRRNTNLGEYAGFIEYMHQGETKYREDLRRNTALQPNYSAAFICFGGERIGSRRRKRRESSFKTADHASSAWVVTGLWVSRAPLSQKCQFG